LKSIGQLVFVLIILLSPIACSAKVEVQYPNNDDIILGTPIEFIYIYDPGYVTHFMLQVYYGNKDPTVYYYPDKLPTFTPKKTGEYNFVITVEYDIRKDDSGYVKFYVWDELSVIFPKEEIDAFSLDNLALVPQIEGGKPQYSYKWWRDGNLLSDSSSSLSVSTNRVGSSAYYCVVTDEMGQEVSSNVVTVVVSDPSDSENDSHSGIPGFNIEGMILGFIIIIIIIISQRRNIGLSSTTRLTYKFNEHYTYKIVKNM
jgi:hypothetical protein